MARKKPLVAIGKRGGKITKLSTVPGRPHEYLRHEIILPFKPKSRVRVVWQGGSSKTPARQETPKPPPQEKPKPPEEKKVEPAIQPEKKTRPVVAEKERGEPAPIEEKREYKREKTKGEIWDKLATPMPVPLREALERGRKSAERPILPADLHAPKDWPDTEEAYVSLVKGMAMCAFEPREHVIMVLSDGRIVARSGDEYGASFGEYKNEEMKYIVHNHPREALASFVLSDVDAKTAHKRASQVEAISIGPTTGHVMGMRYDPRKDPLKEDLEKLNQLWRELWGISMRYPPGLCEIAWVDRILRFLLRTDAFELIGGDNLLLALLQEVTRFATDSETAQNVIMRGLYELNWRVVYDRSGNPLIAVRDPRYVTKLKNSGFTVFLEPG